LEEAAEDDGGGAEGSISSARSCCAEQFFLAGAAQNLKRLVRSLSQPTTPSVGPGSGLQKAIAS